MGVLPKHLATLSTPSREILRVSFRSLVLRPFLRMTRGRVSSVYEIRSAAPRDEGGSVFGRLGMRVGCGVMLRRGVERSLWEPHRSISPQSMYPPREILRVSFRSLVLRPFLRMTRGRVSSVYEIRSAAPRDEGGSVFGRLGMRVGCGVMLRRGVERSLWEPHRSISPQSMYPPREILRVSFRSLVLRPFLRMTRGGLVFVLLTFSE